MKNAIPTAMMVAHRTFWLGTVWLVLTGAEVKGLAVGVFAVPAATWLSLRLMPAQRPMHVWRLALHLPAFVGGSLMGGLDVARRALAAHRPLKPGWVEVPARLSDGARVMLGAELSLMPGTLAAGMRGDRLLVHLLDTEAGVERAIPREEAAIAAMIPKDGAAERAP
ncbi:MAG: Na+/H+ antiporter subunit E [Nioella sp.]